VSTFFKHFSKWWTRSALSTLHLGSDINITVHDYANLRSPDSEHNLAGSYALPRETFVNAYNCYAFLTK
jgi:hypothetical protein